MLSKEKRFFAVISLILPSFILLTSCARSKYTDSLDCDTLSAAAKEAWADDKKYAAYSEEHLKYLFDDDTYHDDFSIIYTTDTNNIDEIGIFHAPDKHSADELYEDACDYIEDMREEQRAFISSYAPEELPKLDGAKVKVFGNYVVYVISDAQRIDSALGAIEDKLK